MKKLVSVFLVLMLLLSALPMGLFSITASAATSGTTGDCTWSLDGTVLTIFGNGNMRGYSNSYQDGSYRTTAPWGYNITRVIIEDGVKNIGDSAFRGCTKLKSIIIPDSVTSIGEHTFQDCDSLASVTIGNGVTSIGIFAFYDSDRLESIIIPDSVTRIGEQAFCNCSFLASVIIGNGVTSMGLKAFYNCDSLASVTISDGVTSIGYHAFSDCDALTLITIPDSVMSIPNEAFCACDSLASVTIGNGVTEIGRYAFCDCDALTSITIPDSVTSIGENTFYNCGSLQYVYYMGSESDRNNIYISSKNSDLTSAIWYYDVFVDGDLYYVPNNSNNTVMICNYEKSATSVTIPATVTKNNITYSVTSIADYAFKDCSSLTSITIPDSVTSIGYYAFSGCNNLETLNLNAINCSSEYGGPGWHKLKTINFGTDVERVGQYMFYNCDSLTSITTPNSVTSIDDAAFYNCSSLTSITVGSGVTSISDQAFANCTSLITVNFNATNCQDMGDWSWSVFENCTSIKTVNIGNNVTNIPDYAFYNCDELTSITIPGSVASIGYCAFSGCNNLETLNLNATNCSSEYGGPGWHNLKTINFGTDVERVGQYMFYNCDSLTSITTPNSVTSIDDAAFYNCSSLTSITIGSGVTSIGNSVFYSCSNLISITIPDSVESMGNNAFYGCSSLEKIQLPFVGQKADGTGFTNFGFIFGACDASYPEFGNKEHVPATLKDVIITGDSSIAEKAFYECASITKITFTGNVKIIGPSAFRKATGLKEITIPASCKSIMSMAFYDCINLTKVYYGGTVAQRENIVINGGNEMLEEYAEWYYNSCIGKSEHTYDHNCDTECNDCGAKRTINHTYDHGCDTDCNICGETRTITHNYKWVTDKAAGCHDTGIKHEECTVCHAKRNENTIIPATGKHTYDHGCDKDCNVCGETRTTSHKYSNNCDASCNVCGATRTAPHSYKTSVTKATTSKNGKIVKTCSGCKKKVTSTIYYAKSFSLSKTSFTYNGKVQTPTVTVKDAKGKVIDPKYYTLSYSSGRKNVGTYKVTITLKGNYSGSKTLSYKINPISISKCKVSISGTSYTYNGKTIKPSVKVLSAGGSTLKNGTHYTVSYSSGCKNPGTYKVTVKMKGSYSGSKTFTYKINPISISKCKVSISGTSYYYNGKVIKPSVKVQTASGSTLKNGTHYTVSYSSGCKNPGTYKVVVKMKGTYSGSKTFTFKIIPPKTSISKITADINTMKVYITKKSTQVTGYEIQYASTSDFTDALTKTITSYNTTSATLSELDQQTTYYVRVRTYKTVSGVKYYSGWSTVKVITTKPAPIVEQ